ncbi:MAG: Gfo/Idh/MocA family oxidoreductase [Chloroflexi bacterium]|nr:Gfo/Idh/MocA family oxidoreductase [Chloroflexota bacterium]
MTVPPLRAALIGCGHISARHIPAWQATPDATLVAVCDQDRARAEARAREFGIGRVYTDVADMLAREPLDCVDIATRPESHAALVELAASQGKHVLCQKPLAATLAEGKAIAASCSRRGVRFMVMEMWRHIPAYRDLRRHVDAGLIGPVHFMRIVGGRRPMAREDPVNPEQPYFSAMPHLFVYEMAIHWIDGARYLMGEVDRVYARMVRINPAIVGEDAAVVVLSHGAGTTLLDGSWASPEEAPRPLGSGGVLLEGRDGSLHFDQSAGELRHITGDGTSVIERYPPPPRSIQAAFDNCIADFAGGVRGQRAFVSSAEDNLRTLAATLAAYDSVAQSTAVAPEPV